MRGKGEDFKALEVGHTQVAVFAAGNPDLFCGEPNGSVAAPAMHCQLPRVLEFRCRCGPRELPHSASTRRREQGTGPLGQGTHFHGPGQSRFACRGPGPSRINSPLPHSAIAAAGDEEGTCRDCCEYSATMGRNSFCCPTLQIRAVKQFSVFCACNRTVAPRGHTKKSAAVVQDRRAVGRFAGPNSHGPVARGGEKHLGSRVPNRIVDRSGVSFEAADRNPRVFHVPKVAARYLWDHDETRHSERHP